MRSSVSKRRAFTLVELMVVIGIIAVLAAVITRGYRNRDRSTKLLHCRANLAAIADAMETFKTNNGEYIHSGEYKFSTTVPGGTKTSSTVSISWGGTGSYYNTEEDVDIAELIKLGDKSLFKPFANLPVQCPADLETRSKEATSYHVICNPVNFTVYCTCGENHYLGSGFPRYIHGLNNSGEVTIKGVLENAAGQTD